VRGGRRGKRKRGGGKGKGRKAAVCSRDQRGNALILKPGYSVTIKHKATQREKGKKEEEGGKARVLSWTTVDYIHILMPILTLTRLFGELLRGKKRWGRRREGEKRRGRGGASLPFLENIKGIHDFLMAVFFLLYCVWSWNAKFKQEKRKGGGRVGGGRGRGLAV